jgi:hypothetical protein
VQVVRVAGQATAGLDGLGPSCQDGNPVPALLAVPDRAVADCLDRGCRELPVGGLKSCRQATSGSVSASQRSSTGRRPLMPLTLKVAIFMTLLDLGPGPELIK